MDVFGLGNLCVNQVCFHVFWGVELWLVIPFWRIQNVLHDSTKMKSHPLPAIAFQGNQQPGREIQLVFQAFRIVLHLT
jgi:hypothetical protein